MNSALSEIQITSPSYSQVAFVARIGEHAHPVAEFQACQLARCDVGAEFHAIDVGDLEQRFALGGHFARFGVFDQYRPSIGFTMRHLARLVFDLSHLVSMAEALFVDAAVAVFERRGALRYFFEYGDLRVDIVQLFGVRGVGFQQVFDAPFSRCCVAICCCVAAICLPMSDVRLRVAPVFLELQAFQVEVDAVDRADGLSGREPPAFFHAERK